VVEDLILFWTIPKSTRNHPLSVRAPGIDDGDTLGIRHFPFCEGHLLVKNVSKIIPTKFLLNRWIEYDLNVSLGLPLCMIGILQRI
jgi:hypothetical protein